MFKRIFLIVLDSLGIGEQEDAEQFNDLGSHTIGHIIEKYPLHIPHLISLGYGNITPVQGLESVSNPRAHVGKMREISLGKDTMTGHWELMGLQTKEAFQTFTDTGFPEDLIKLLEEKTGHNIVGNISASGTEIIKEYGEHHMKTGDLIVYTSADSVLQIAMHEAIIPIKRQYEISKIARDIMIAPQWKVGRVITRPFIGTNKDNFKRTSNRHDYALKPFKKTVLNFLSDGQKEVIALGKINDIFDGYGITSYEKTISNEDGMEKIIKYTKQPFEGLCFLNLVDFDALYGHRRDPIGYGQAIEAFDVQLKTLLEQLNDDDLLILTADHGNDPTHHGTDHTREFVPLMCYHKNIKEAKHLGTRTTFADLGATIADNFNIEMPVIGSSFLDTLK
ncbi:MAG: phosphopentomutase [Firmicutes bacterium]|nr:phosphopentomutase [Bacillota bacterium]